jgi:hypothetical protein
MLHLHFAHLEQGKELVLLAGDHGEVLAAIRDRDTAQADAFAHSNTRQYSVITSSST